MDGRTDWPETTTRLTDNPSEGTVDQPGIVTLPGRSTHHGEIDIWLIHLADRPRCHGLDWLSATERARAERFSFARDRDRYCVAHVAMRELLASYGSQPPGTLAFLDGSFGKPHLSSPSPAFRFNLSHSDDLALLGVSRQLEIGVDIELVRPQMDIEQLAGQTFTDCELSEFAAIPPHDRQRAFFWGWTRKEACLKAVGRGLSISMVGFETGFKNIRKTSRLMVDSDCFEVAVESIDVGSDAAAAVAWLVPSPPANRD